ncbi:MAG: DNA repair protein RecO [Patescibacteria group bacterium]|nr:DNA repair protein RecO [Patescibacteria group bacterium]
MKEYLTEAVVLNVKPYKETDRLVDLYTKDFGRVVAKVTGGRRATSKLSPHLDTMSLVETRLIQKNRFTVADVMVKERFRFLREDLRKNSSALKLMFLLRSLVPELTPDLQFWHHLIRSLKQGKVSTRTFLELLGYNPLLASCESCYAREISHFSLVDQSFLCRQCSLKFRTSLGSKLFYVN